MEPSVPDRTPEPERRPEERFPSILPVRAEAESPLVRTGAEKAPWDDRRLASPEGRVRIPAPVLTPVGRFDAADGELPPRLRDGTAALVGLDAADGKAVPRLREGAVALAGLDDADG